MVWVRERFPWMGRYSGYDLICNAVSESRPEFSFKSIFRRADFPLPFGISKLCRILSSRYAASPGYDKFSFYTELKAAAYCLFHGIDLIHMTFVENHLCILPRFTKLLGTKLVGTVHQPQSWWREKYSNLQILSELDAIITLAKKDIEYFQNFLPGRVYHVPHGVDTSFFRPSSRSPSNSFARAKPRFIFVGQWMRDSATTVGIIKNSLEANSSVNFDLVVPMRNPSVDLLVLPDMYDQVALHRDFRKDLEPPESYRPHHLPETGRRIYHWYNRE